MMQQYRALRKSIPEDTILFFRMGDFYEMFFDDAKEAAQILDIALTKRSNVPMCGVPFHASEGYLAKFIRAGKKVAICDQMEDPALAKGIVKREITRVVTPGTILEEQVLESNRHNYLAGLCRQGEVYGLALLDLSTGSFCLEETNSADAIRDNLMRYAPSECLIPEADRDNSELQRLLASASQTLLTPHDDWTFEFDAANDLLARHFRVHSLQGFGCEPFRAGVGAAGGVLHYVKQELHRNTDHIRRLQVVNPSDYMLLDDSTVQNLDMVATRGSTRRGVAVTLLGVLDSTKTPMGGRLMREWLLRPLAHAERIIERHDAVDGLVNDWRLLEDIRELLAGVKDMERLISRLSAGGGNGRDLRSVASSLSALPAIKARLIGQTTLLLAGIREEIEPLPDVVDWIERALVDEPPITIKEGGLLRKGYHQELDELHDAASLGRQWLADYQTREQERTGIKSLKVRHNKVFGYYIEITNSNLNLTPSDYIRKQTLVNAERFITPELKDYENRILGAQDRAVDLEYELFLELRGAVVAHMDSIQRTASQVATLDVLASLAERARSMRYTRPVINNGTNLIIRDGRHPVIEQMPDAERFVPNDTHLDTEQNQLIIITGPNMAGKSTYIRQVALLVIMAQTGSFVPAYEAEVGVVDRVFTRVGASDDLVRGRSTFMVEMQETANILNNATTRSLIVLDEIGRGTSTYDGISIAWAVAEFLHENGDVKAKTLFATHYHELTDLALTMRGVKNYNVLVREKDDTIAFLRKIVPGGADKSYGIQVARLAGLPERVIERAREILANLEDEEYSETGQPQLALKRVRKDRTPAGQMSLFDGF